MRLEVQETLLMGAFANGELSALLTHCSRWIPNLTHRNGSAFLGQWGKIDQDGHPMDTRKKRGITPSP